MKKIVIIDDESDILLALRGVLENSGYQVEEANNGLSALRIIKEILPDLIISDVLMPEMNGFELVNTLKQLDSTRDIPVILLIYFVNFSTYNNLYPH